MTNKKDSEDRDRIKIIKTRLENDGLIGADDIHFAVAIAEEGLKEKTCGNCEFWGDEASKYKACLEPKGNALVLYASPKDFGCTHHKAKK